MEGGNHEREDAARDLKNRMMQLKAELLLVHDSLRLLATDYDLPYEGKLLNEGIARSQLEAMNHEMTKSKQLMSLSPGYLGNLQPDERQLLHVLESKIAEKISGNNLVYELPNFFQFHPRFITDILQKPWVFLVCPAGPFFGDDVLPKSVIPKGTWTLKKEVVRLFDGEIEVGKARTYVFGDFSFELYRAHSNPYPSLGNPIGWTIGNLVHKNEKNLSPHLYKMVDQKPRPPKRKNSSLNQDMNVNEVKGKQQKPLHCRSSIQLKREKKETM